MVPPILVSLKHSTVYDTNQKHNNFTKSNCSMANAALTHAGGNVIVGGALMSCLLIMIACVCYLCHWIYQKNEDRYSQRRSWTPVASDSDMPFHIFTLDQQCFDRPSLFCERENRSDIPPPTYEEVTESNKRDEEASTTFDHDPDLPSYETAVKLSGNGYV